MASALASLPIENSPPGIQTMPGGAGEDGDEVFGTVASKGALDASCREHALWDIVSPNSASPAQ
jgi:hypothetical protein